MCMNPYKLPDEEQYVPCGKCPECIARRASGWSFRLMQEEKRRCTAHFITLTYNTVSVPITQNGFMSLKKDDFQNFMKRLRQDVIRIAEWKIPLKYYLVGEYGTIKNRPHYHLLLFGLPDTYYVGKQKISGLKLVENQWTQGNIFVGTITGASIGYTLKYLEKPRRGKQFDRDDRQVEFGVMSKGLGEGYLTEDMVKWHKADLKERMYLNIEGNKKISMPRYYKNKLYTDQERRLIAAQNVERMELIEKEKMQQLGPELYYKQKIAANAAKYQKQSESYRKNRKL